MSSLPNFLRSSRPRSFSAGNRGPSAVVLTRSLDEGKKRQAAVNSCSNPNRYKTELCRPFQEYGYCKYADKCQFAHGMHELRALPRHPKYKTDLCRTFHTKGFCPYGPRCHFIHSLEEARQAPPIITRTSSASVMTSIPNYPPLSPSQDSGISSPDDTGCYFVAGTGKVFDFPMSDGSLEDIDMEGDVTQWRKPRSHMSSEWNGGSWKRASPTLQSSTFEQYPDVDSISNCSSPTKSVGHLSSSTNLDYDLSEQLSCVSLDESYPLHSRLPVFDDMINSSSDTALDP